MHEPDLPQFGKGTKLTAADLNKLAAAIRPLLMPGSYWNDQMSLQRPKRGGGGSTTNLTAFAVVTEEAGAATYNSDTMPFTIVGGTTGKALLLTDDKSIGGLTTGPPRVKQEIEFKSVQRVPIEVGTFIILSSTSPIKPGSAFEKSPVYGRYLEPVDWMWAKGGQAMKTWATPETATEAMDQQWMGTVCDA